MHNADPNESGIVDHLWIRVADVAAAKAFYIGIGPRAGIALDTDLPERAQFAWRDGTFSLVAGEPTEHVAFTFAGPGPAGMQRDPDGNTVEILTA